jgi:hypothetical protein
MACRNQDQPCGLIQRQLLRNAIEILISGGSNGGGQVM